MVISRHPPNGCNQVKRIISLCVIFLLLIACSKTYHGPTSRKKGRAKSGAPTGKYRNPTLFSTVNPFQGRAKAKLNKSKRKQIKLIKRKRKQSGTYRKGKKPGRTFGMKRTISRGRLKSSGSRTRSKGGSRGRKNKDLFNTRKK